MARCDFECEWRSDRSTSIASCKYEYGSRSRTGMKAFSTVESKMAREKASFLNGPTKTHFSDPTRKNGTQQETTKQFGFPHRRRNEARVE